MEQKLVRVPFEVELAKRIQSGECKGRIVTRDGRSARVICWDRQYKRPIISLIVWDDIEEIRSAFINGKIDENREDFYDLMLEIPEYMTFKDGDILSSGEDVFILKEIDGRSKAKYYACTFMNYDLFDSEVVAENLVNSLRLATEEEKQKLINALRESKEPKAKEYLKRFFGIEQKQEYEFKPFDKVICRDDYSEWFVDMFSHIDKNGLYACIGHVWNYCIPYNDQTAHLLGTTEDYKEE